MRKNHVRPVVGTLSAIALFAASPALGQVPAGVTVGMQVTDASGAPVGTVSAVQGSNLVIKTDKHEALLPVSGFTPANGKLLFGMTQAQLDSQIEQAVAAANASIAAGATVKGLGGTAIGTIESVADGKAVITLQDGKKIAVPQEGLRGNADRTVTIGYSAAQLEAMIQNSSPAPQTSGQ